MNESLANDQDQLIEKCPHKRSMKRTEKTLMITGNVLN
jgi:hypothetical protein